MWQQLILNIVCILQFQQATVIAMEITVNATALYTVGDQMFFADSDKLPALLTPFIWKLGEPDDYTLLLAGGVTLATNDKQNYVHHMVSLRSRHYIKSFGDNHFCAGTIIGANIVLTAAHCVMDKRGVMTRPRRMIVIAGTPFRTQCNKTTLRYEVAALVAQPSKQLDHSNELAIVRIKGAFPHGNINVRIIYLPTVPPPYGHNCTMLGWGRMYYRGPLSDAALHVNVSLLHPLECEQLRSDIDTSGLICAANAVEEFECDTCPGDAGGPLICDGQLTGIISWNLLCGNISLPSIFVTVQPQLDWIVSIMMSGGLMSVANAHLCLLLSSLILL